MGFSGDAKQYFYIDLDIDNREISKRMNNYSESLISRYLNQDKISATFVLKVKEFFPESGVEKWGKGDSLSSAQEPSSVYKVNPVKKINKIIAELEELKKHFKEEMSQK